MDIGAGSRADSVRPALPTTVSISGIAATAISSCCKTRLFSSTPAWGSEVGINKKEPSLSEGINSCPMLRIIIKPRITKTVGTDKNNNLLRKAQLRMRV